MEQVKQMVDAGARIPVAVKEALLAKGLTIASFAEKYGLGDSATRNAINGLQRAGATTLSALATELGGTADEWAEMLWLAAKPIASAR
jgi:transcriptional regulator with XRE-family HTH domain